MPRIRAIKPEFFRNEQLAELPLEDRLLFIGLWTQADREGRLEDRPKRLKGELFPYDDLNIDAGLGRLANAGLIVRYEVNSQRLICIPTWAKHQQPNVKEAASQLPERDGTVPALCENGASTTGREGNGTEQERKGMDEVLRARFELFWAVYPRKVGKDAALAQWLRIRPDLALSEEIVVAVERQSRSPQWRKDGGQFVPHPRTWLSQGRWQDAVDLEPVVSDFDAQRESKHQQAIAQAMDVARKRQQAS